MNSINQGINELAKFELGTKEADEFKEQALKQMNEKKEGSNPLFMNFSPNTNDIEPKVLTGQSR